MEPARGVSSRTATTKKPTARRGKGLPRRAQDLSKEELLLTLQKKKECNAKALKIVEGMLEPNVKEVWFLDVLQHINQSHLEDVNEERAITKLCGYPLCSNELQNIPPQQYRISTKLNKVYDIKDRKNFCSNTCFVSNKFIKNQMHTSPLWLRDIEGAVKFTLMPSSESWGGAGDEVNVLVERVSKEEVKQLSGEERKASSPPEESLADVLSKLHVVTSLRAEKSSKLSEHIASSGENSSQEKEAVAGIIKKIDPERVTEITSSSKCIESKDCFREETHTVKHDPRSDLPTEASQDQMEIGEITSGIKEISITNHLKRKCNETVELEYSGKLPNVNHVPPVDQTKKMKENVITANSGVPKRTDQECDTMKIQKIVTSENIHPKVVVSENPHKAISKAIPKAETSIPLAQAKVLDQSKPSISTNEKKKQKQKQKQTKGSTTHQELLPIISHVEKCLEEWFTMDTMCFLFGESALKDMLAQKGESIQAHYNALGTVTWDEEKHERFLAICKRLSLLDLEDNNFDNQVRNEGEKRKPLPDYDALKKEAEAMELKIKAFYNGNMEIEEKKVTFAEDTKNNGDDSNEAQAQIPLVHLHSQRSLRKRIVLNGLNRVLPDFLRTFGMRPSEMAASIRGLVGTFALSSTNITFKPPEWSLLGLIIIKLLALREAELKYCLESEKSKTYLTLMLMSYKQEPGYFEHLLSWLTDIDKLLARPKDKEVQI